MTDTMEVATNRIGRLQTTRIKTNRRNPLADIRRGKPSSSKVQLLQFWWGTNAET